MKKLTSQRLILFALTVLIFPSIAMAAWWNPVSWGIWNIVSEGKHEQPAKIQSTSTINTIPPITPVTDNQPPQTQVNLHGILNSNAKTTIKPSLVEKQTTKSTQLDIPSVVFKGGGSLEDISCQNIICVAVGNTTAGASQIVLSTDAGKTWSIILAKKFINTNGGPSLESVSCKDNLCVAVGGGGIILRSSDSGKNWTFQENILSNSNKIYYNSNISSVSCVNNQICYLVGDNFFGGGGTPDFYKALGSFILKTDDAGLTWNTVKNIKPDLSNNKEIIPEKILCTSESECFGVGYPRYVFHTIDGWKTVDKKKLSNNLGDFSGITMSGSTFMVTDGYHSRLLFRSIDNGKSWENISIPQSTNNFGGNIACTNKDCLLIFQNLPGERVDILESSDNGITWKASVYNKKASIYGISCIDSGCYAVGDLAPTGIVIKVK